MDAVSSALLAALSGPGPDRTQVYGELWSVRSGLRIATLELSGGSITQSRTAATRRTVTCTVPVLEGLTPDEGTTGVNRAFGDGTFGSGTFGGLKRRYLRGLLLPLTTQLRVYARFLLPDTNTWETRPQGRFTVTDATFVDDGDEGGSVTITGSDASFEVAAAKWQKPFVIKDGTTVAAALQALIADRVPGLAVHCASAGPRLNQMIYAPGYQQGRDPWQDAQNLASLAGWELYVDRDGVVQAALPVDPSRDTADWELHDDGKARRFEQTPSAADFANTIVVFAESSSTKPVSATVQDLNGPYGVNTIGRVVAVEYRSSGLKTATDAYNAGIAELRRRNAFTEQVVVVSSPVPHGDAGDIASLSSSGLQLEDELYIVETVVWDFDFTQPSRVTVSRRL